MKNIVLAICLTLSSGLMAQTAKELATQTGQGLCDCVNKTYGFIDKDVQHAIIKMTTIQNEEEQQAFVMSLSEELQQRMIDQATKMQDDGISASFTACLNAMERDLYQAIDNMTDTEITEEKFLELMFESLEDSKDCEFATFVFKMGMEEEEQCCGKSEVKEGQQLNQTSEDQNTGKDERYGSGGN